MRSARHREGLYIVMKLIGGPSLDRKLGGFVADGKAPARLVKTLAEAVHCAHQRGDPAPGPEAVQGHDR